MLPFYETLGVTVGAVLTDNGREFCGKEDTRPFELTLAMDGIEHRITKVRSPRTNGFVERMNRALLDECFRVEAAKLGTSKSLRDALGVQELPPIVPAPEEMAPEAA